MKEELIRTGMLLGEKAIKKLQNARVAVFGIGGVGGYAAEALARAGVGELELIDHDTVSVSNINRQIIALHSTVGRKKVDVMKERIADINPDCKVTARDVFYLPENADGFDFYTYDAVVDAIDTVTAKIDIIKRCTDIGTPVISAMGTGNKLDPSKLTICDIYMTSVCPLARVMRRELRARGVKKLDVLYSTEEPIKPDKLGEIADDSGRRGIPGSTSFVPPAAGLMIAGYVVRRICGLI